MSTVYDYPFSQDELEQANKDWGCNCGPSALAFALQCSLDEVRALIPGFKDKRFTSPSMMKSALRGHAFTECRELDRYAMFAPEIALVRVQFTGPWTKEGANPKWAYHHTHWIAAWEYRNYQLVFDCNGGEHLFRDWELEIVSQITKTISRADGDWFPTHIWRLTHPTAPLAAGEETKGQ